MDIEGVIQGFGRAGLVAVPADRPFARGEQAEAIFGMDIRQDGGREFFRIWPGQGNAVHICDPNASERQLVLSVKESERTMDLKVPIWTVRHQKRRHGERWVEMLLLEHGARRRDVLELDEETDHVVIRRTTPAEQRHMLCGMDERHYFAAGLPEAATTVRQAHELLRDEEVSRAMRARSRIERPKRQGEWFFLRCSGEELEEIERANKAFVRRKADIETVINGRRRGNTHTADEVLRMPDGEIFVRGKVRHVEHKTLKLRDWHRVVRNTEKMDQNQALGIHWID